MPASFIASTIVLIFLLDITLVVALDWTYSGLAGPAYWGEKFPKCKGNGQSPINIDTSKVKVENLGRIRFTGYDVAPEAMVIKNNGHSVQVGVTGDVSISDGGLKGPYVLSQLHFHWGRASANGAEHTIDNKQAVMELHFVHYDAAYGNLTSAVDKKRGLAVTSVLLQESDVDNPALSKLTSKISEIVISGLSAKLEPFPLEQLLPSNPENFYRYYGSLTTPTCDESVMWTVFKETLKISSEQIKEFPRTKYSNGIQLEDNFRPVQPLNGRDVIATFIQSSGAICQPTVILMTSMLAIARSFIRYY